MENNNEVVFVDVDYDQPALYDYFKQLDTSMLEDTSITYREQFPDFPGDTIWELKQWLTTQGRRDPLKGDHERLDIIAHPDHEHPSIKPILDQLAEREWKIGLVTFFKQKNGEDVPAHVDYPYRKGSLLMLPIIHNEFQLTDAVTYYQDGGSYRVESPCIMNVMKIHGVKNVNGDRLMLHIELPEMTL